MKVYVYEIGEFRSSKHTKVYAEKRKDPYLERHQDTGLPYADSLAELKEVWEVPGAYAIDDGGVAHDNMPLTGKWWPKGSRKVREG
jgi:hypothetical protein